MAMDSFIINMKWREKLTSMDSLDSIIYYNLQVTEARKQRKRRDEKHLRL